MEGATATSVRFESRGDSVDFSGSPSDYRAWYVEKRKVDNRERTRRCHARKNETRDALESSVVRSESVDPKFCSLGPKKVARTSATLAREIGVYAAKKLKNHDTDVQHLTIMKFLGQPVLTHVVSPFLSNHAAVKLRHEAMGSFKDGLQAHLVELRKGKSLLAKNIVTTLAVAPGMGSGRGVAGLLGVDRRNIKKALARRVLLDNSQDAFWLQDVRRVRAGAISDSNKKTITKWWEEETTVSPNRKDIIRKWIAPKVYIEHATHYLQQSQLVLSATILKKKYTLGQIVGCLLVTAGVIVVVSNGSGGDVKSISESGLFWPLVMIGSTVFSAGASIIKEFVFKDAAKRLGGGQSVDIFVVNTFGSSAQALFVFLLLHVLSSLKGIPFQQLPTYFRDGAACFVNLGGECYGAPVVPTIYVAINLAFNISNLSLLKQSSTVVSSLYDCGGAAVHLAFYILVGTPSSMPPGLFVGAAILVAGLAFYNFSREKQQNEMKD